MEGPVDPAFDRRWNEGLRDFLRNRKNIWNHGLQVGQSPRRAEDLNRHELRRAFSSNTFIYGTVGVDAGHYGGRGSCAAVRTINMMTKKGVGNGGTRRTQANFPGQPEVWTDGAARTVARFFENIRRQKQSYDPGVRASAYLKNGYQMMDMYYGMHGKPKNNFWRQRNTVIAEFVHHVMGYHSRRGGVPFNAHEPGWRTFARVFPDAREGWFEQNATTAAYGQSATKEISRIIRRGIWEFGGKIIFEGRDIFYSQVFSRQRATRDTDVEAQALLPYFWRPKASEVPYGEGTLEFQWAGQPAVPTRAHFLTNWEFSPDPKTTHTEANRKGGFELGDNENDNPWFKHLLKLLSKRHNLRTMWHHFANFPDDSLFIHRPPKFIAGVMAAAIHHFS